MGLVVNCLNIGVKGSLRLVLGRESYAAGEVVKGQLVLRVSRYIECKEFSMHVVGAEIVTWTDGASNTLTPYRMRDEFFYEDMYNVDPIPRTLEPGEFHFGFSLPLSDSLPPVFRVAEGSAGAMRNVHATVAYTIRARLKLRGKVAAVIETTHDLAVFRPSLCHPVRSLQRSSADEVRLLSLIKSKGTCEVMVTLDRDVQISGSTLSLQARISNYSSRDMHSIFVLVHEDLTVELPHRRLNKGTRTVCTHEYSGVAAGQLTDKVLHLPLIYDESRQPVAPTNSAAFIRWQYRLEVKCRFLLSKSVKVEMPIIILRNVGAPPASVTVFTSSPPALVGVGIDQE